MYRPNIILSGGIYNLVDRYMGSADGNNELCCLNSIIYLLKLRLVDNPSFVKGSELGKAVNSDIHLIKFKFPFILTNLILPNNHLFFISLKYLPANG